MKTKSIRLALCASVLALAAASAAVAQSAASAPAAAAPAARPGPQPAEVTLKMVKPDVYMAVGGGGNSTVRVTRNGVILVDTKNMGEQQYQNLLAAIKTVTDKKVKFVFDTHHHADHTGNNEFFERDGAKVIGSNAIAGIFKTYVSSLAPHTPAAPNVPYANRYRIVLGGATAQAYHFGPGHTGGDTVVYFPQSKVVALGDLLVTSPTVPNYDAPFGGKLRGFRDSIAETLKLDFDVAIPGHGAEPLTKAEVQAYKEKLDTLIDRATELVKAGTPEDQFIATIKTDDLGWKLGGQFWAPKPRLDALYAELSK